MFYLKISHDPPDTSNEKRGHSKSPAINPIRPIIHQHQYKNMSCRDLFQTNDPHQRKTTKKNNRATPLHNMEMRSKNGPTKWDLMLIYIVTSRIPCSCNIPYILSILYHLFFFRLCCKINNDIPSSLTEVQYVCDFRQNEEEKTYSNRFIRRDAV